MNSRRSFLLAGCACCAGLAVRDGRAQGAGDYLVPQRFDRPHVATDEGGLWALMDREERELRRSPLVIRDEALKNYVQAVACRLGGEHCPDVRIFLVRTPLFNASMAPNGMMQVWTGLLLRLENEAQLAAVLGHEMGHYLQRHSVERLRDIKSRAAANQVLSLFGGVGAIGQLALMAGQFAYNRDHEREADQIGAFLMRKAGYDVGESARVWGNLLQEVKAREGADAERQTTSIFATHPAPPERQSFLEDIAKTQPGGAKGEDAYARQTARFLDDWLHDEVKRGQYAESLVLLSRQIDRGAPRLMNYYRGEVYRLRAEAGDTDLALADYRVAAGGSTPLAPAYRGIGLISRQRGQRQEALDALSRYLDLAPDAPDAPFIKTYVSELRS